MRPRLVAAVGDVAVDRRIADTALPAAPRRSDDRAEDGVHGVALGGRRERRDHVEVHPGSVATRGPCGLDGRDGS